MNKKISKRFPNVAPKTLATILMALSLTGCKESSDRQMGYMSPSEREDYEMYGITPNDVKDSKSNNDIWTFLGFGAGLLVTYGAINALIDNSKKKQK